MGHWKYKINKNNPAVIFIQIKNIFKLSSLNYST